MTDSADLRRLADVVDHVDDVTPVDVDGAQVLSGGGEDLRAKLTIAVAADADLEVSDVDSQETTGEDTEELECDVAGCDFTSKSERGLAIHKGRVHANDEDEDENGTSTEADTEYSESVSEARTSGLEEDAEDGAPVDDAGDDVQDESTDAEEISVDAVDRDGDGGDDVALPAGVTEDDVKAAVDEHETVGDVGEAIGVTRGRARTITSVLGLYGELKDLPAGGRHA
ncbi:hypothetical protein [Natronobacterium gregoryi]|nr:hypothetical protein [Natronobacterium gregoryi]AFZ74601.1 hypothetical protein Natgr_3482 [Natronobacterium gregoryi SP2]SFJ30256.1 hypothetical protein SAMN05443661_12119 [Natronobacterium gregoryi]